MTLLPAYMTEAWKCYEQMHREDLQVIDPALVSVDPMTCHPSVLPHLALEAGVSIDGFSEEIQRGLIAGTVKSAWCRGTKKAVEGALDAIVDVDIVEWFEYGGEPYTFKIDLSTMKDVEITAEMAERVKTIAESSKNTRSHITEMLLSYRVGTEIFTHVGIMCESAVYAEMVDGFEETMTCYAVAQIGAMGEVSAVAIMEGV